MTLMCLFVLVACVQLSVAMPPEVVELLLELIKDCSKKENLPASDMALMKAEKEPITQEGKCFVGCMFEELGVFKDGKFHAELAEEMYKAKYADDPEMLIKAEATHAICDKEAEMSGNDKCKNGLSLLMCIRKAMPDFEMFSKLNI